MKMTLNIWGDPFKRFLSRGKDILSVRKRGSPIDP
jgi:hypothetical protein